MPLRHLRNNIWPQRSIHHPAKHSRRNFLRQQPMTITTKCSTQLCMGSQIQPWDTPDKTQTEHTQVTQKTLTEKATGEKHIIVCLYFSRKIHPISPTFTKLILKTVNGSCVDDIKRRLFQLFTTQLLKKCWRTSGSTAKDVFDKIFIFIFSGYQAVTY